MKLSVSSLACPDWSLEEIASACVTAGIAGIELRGLGGEIDITRLPAFNGDLPATLALLHRHQLQLPCFATSVTLVSPSPQRWQDMLDEAHRYATLAQKTATPFLRIFGGAIPKGMSEDEALAMAQRHLRQVVKICRPRGVQALLETHDIWATAAAARRLLHEFDPAEAGVLWDIEHPARQGESPADTAASLHRWIRHVHLKDSLITDGVSKPRLLGQGDLPVEAVLQALSFLGYDGWICLETEKRWHIETAPAPEESIPQFAQFMRTHVSSLA